MIDFPRFFDRKTNRFYDESELVKRTINGIPRFIEGKSYASLFGDQWKEYAKTQLDSYTRTSISTDRLNRCLGPLNDLNGKLVLEAGCGAGRFTEGLLQKGAKLVSADISSAVEVNRDNFPVSENHIIIQADINDMPFENETFDLVVCLGVIQHTPNSANTIRDLYSLVKKGGTLVIDHYTYSKSSLFRTAPVFRTFLKRMPSEKTIPITRKIVKFFLPLHKKAKGKKLFSVILNRISPVVSYYDTIPQLDDKAQEEWALLDTHDSLTDWYKRFLTKGEVYRILEKLGAVNIWCEYGGNGVEARCVKPA